MLLAWDTTSRRNWGARGAHVSIYQLLTDRLGGDIDCLPGEYQTESVPIGYALPDQLAYLLSRRRDQFWFAAVYDKMERLTGGEWDYLDENPQKSLENILNNTDNEYINRFVEYVKENAPIVLDGNGDMIFKDSPSRNLMFTLATIELAKYFGKEVYYVNAIFSGCADTGWNQPLAERCVEALRMCDGIAFRDPQSLALAQDADEALDAEWVPDSMFYWYDDLEAPGDNLPASGDCVIPYTREKDVSWGALDFSSSYVCVTGGSRAAWTPEQASAGYVDLVEQLQRLDCSVYLVSTSAGDHFLYDVAEETGTPLIPAEVPILTGGSIVANAELFITGRYHPAIMASMGGTPCVFLGADSHKTLSLQQLLGYEEPHVYSAIPGPGEHEAILNRSRELMQGGERVRTRIQQEAEKCADETTRLATLIGAP